MENIRILVPLDFSELSTSALHSARQMARLFEGTITPFHSYLPLSEVDGGPYMFGGMGSTAIDDYEEIETALHSRLSELGEENVDPSLLTKPLISIGNPAQAIVEEAKDFDMIVMSTHGRTGFSRFFLGSVAEKVLRMSHLPVLIVNEDREVTNLNRILLTTDFSDHSKAAFPYAKEIALKANAKLELINIFAYDPEHDSNPDKSKIELRNQRLKILAKEELHELDDLISTNVIVSTDTPHEAILNYNSADPYDLVVMSTVGRTGIDYLMMGSTTANVVRHVKSPVLSINPKQEAETE
ncbi:Nucleotide-binding universal stress protein, UspA family [Fodinibius roseus]|uniref:Nucleotide-binding universal stress protein, UspA family n=1 Tax=Fodinibius roseus TaxID=1194090 RepID=A0A1M5BGT2_9BACT|nr:universal stress protein [Fodinibius roseus]SHF41487.1 Nucleotide-binding universal stress protein, UspA family [Fodinibius roseus]